MGTDLDRAFERAPITHRVRGEYDPGQMALIRTTIAKDCNDGELAMFLEVCARYELDPFSKQIWAAKMGGKLQIIVSRDGLLALANRSPDFRGCESDVVREKDHFRKYRDSEHGTVVDHSYQGVGEETRGKIVGSWALVHREGHFPTYFFAEWDTYSGQNVWKSHPEAMIVKVAEAMALRKAFSISGVVGEAEVDRQVLTESGDGGSTPEIDWGEDEELAAALRQRFEALGYRRAKVRLMLRGKTDEERQALLAELDGLLDARPAGEEPEPVDAEVVPEEGGVGDEDVDTPHGHAADAGAEPEAAAA